MSNINKSSVLYNISTVTGIKCVFLYVSNYSKNKLHTCYYKLSETGVKSVDTILNLQTSVSWL